MQRTFTVGGSDISETHAKYYMRLKKMLKQRGVAAAEVDSCDGLHELRILGIRVGVLSADRDLEEISEDEADGEEVPLQRTLSAAQKLKQHREPNKPAPNQVAEKAAPSWMTRKRAPYVAKKEVNERADLARDHAVISTTFEFTWESDPPGCKGFRLNNALANIGRVKCLCGESWTAHPDSLDVETARKCINLQSGGSNTMTCIRSPDCLGGEVTGVWVGSLHDAKRHTKLEEAGITHVLNTAADLELVDGSFREDPARFGYLHLNLQDNKQAAEDMSALLDPTCFDFIEQALAEGGQVLLHCAQGKSRSGTVAVYWVMRKFRLEYEDALSLVQRVRGIVEPNGGFERILRKHALKWRK